MLQRQHLKEYHQMIIIVLANDFSFSSSPTGLSTTFNAYPWDWLPLLLIILPPSSPSLRFFFCQLNYQLYNHLHSTKIIY